MTATRRYPRPAHCGTLTCANGHTGAVTLAHMTDEEIAELVAENQRLRALAESETVPEAAPVVIEAPDPPPVAETVAIIEAETERTVAIIEAETQQQVAVIEAQAEAEQPKGDSDEGGDGGLFMPEADHWYFKRWGGRK